MMSTPAVRPKYGIAAFILFMASVSHAQLKPPPKHEIHWANLTGGQYNPVGVASFFEFTYRLRLTEQEAPVLRENYVGLGLTLDLTPVWIRGGVHFHLQPISILKLGVEVLGLQGFGILGSAQAFDTPTDDWSQAVMDERASEAVVMTAWAARAFLQFKIKWNIILFRNTTRLSYWNHRLPPGATAVFAAGISGLRPQNGWTIENMTETGVWLLDERLLLGVRHWMVNVFHPGYRADPNGPSHILGPGIGWTFQDVSSVLFNRPTLFFHVGWHINHTNRTGAMPYIAIALSFDGRLWASD